MGFLKIFAIFGVVGDWYERAMEDGRVSLAELVELGVALGEVVGFTVDPEVSALVAGTATDALDAVDDAVETVKEVVEEFVPKVQ